MLNFPPFCVPYQKVKMSLVYLCCGILSLSVLRLMNAENVLTDWNSGDGGLKWRPKCEFSFHDIEKNLVPIYPIVTSEECGRFCIANSYCRYFNYDLRGLCYMAEHVSLTVHEDHDYESIAICGFIPWRLDSETGI